MNQKALFNAVRATGCTIRKTEHGEYRVVYRGGSEASAYYTNDREDALATAKAIAARIADLRDSDPAPGAP